jgi:hypothetical protein
MTFVEDDDVIQTFTAGRSDEAFDKRILPGRPRSGNDLFNAHPLNPATESRTVRRVSISQQKPRCGVPGKGIDNLLGKPNLRGIFGHAEMNDFSPLWICFHSGDYAHLGIMRSSREPLCETWEVTRPGRGELT